MENLFDIKGMLSTRDGKLYALDGRFVDRVFHMLLYKFSWDGRQIKPVFVPTSQGVLVTLDPEDEEKPLSMYLDKDMVYEILLMIKEKENINV